MPIGFLSDAERERLDSFPLQITPGDIATYFTLSARTAQLPRTTSAANRLGFALQPQSDPHVADLQPDLPEAGLVHELTSATRP